MAVPTFSSCDWKCPFWAKTWSKKIKIVSLSWNLITRAIRICRIQWWCSHFPFLTGNVLFGIKITSLSWNLGPRPVWIYRIQWWCSLCMCVCVCVFFFQKLLSGKFYPANKNCQFKLKLDTYINSNMQNCGVHFFCFIPAFFIVFTTVRE